MTMSAVARLAKLTYAAARCIGFREALSSICVASILVAIMPERCSTASHLCKRIEVIFLSRLNYEGGAKSPFNAVKP